MTAEEREAMILVLAARKKVYRILQDFWMHEPAMNQLEALYDPALGVALDLLTPEGEKSLKESLEDLHVSSEDFNEEYLKEIKREYYTMLAPRPDKPAAPFATKYRALSPEALHEEMLVIAATYERYGTRKSETEMAAEGYLAMELSFMARTCGLAQQAIEMGIDRRAKQLFDEQHWFLNDHLLLWVPIWIKALREYGKDNFYSRLAYLTEHFLVCDSQGLEEISTMV